MENLEDQDEMGNGEEKIAGFLVKIYSIHTK